MISYREEANKLGIESEHLFGYRNIGYFRLDQQLRDIKGLSKFLNEAKNIRSKKAQIKLVKKAIENTQKKTDYGHVHWVVEKQKKQ